MQTQTQGGGLQGLIESLGSIWITRETIRSESAQQANNSADDFPRVATGVNSDGSTMQTSRIIAGVDDRVLFAGVAVAVVSIAALVWAIAD